MLMLLLRMNNTTTNLLALLLSYLISLYSLTELGFPKLPTASIKQLCPQALYFPSSSPITLIIGVPYIQPPWQSHHVVHL